MTTHELQELARQRVDSALEQLANYSGVTLPAVRLDCSLRGRSAGQAGIKGAQLTLRINLPVMARYLDDYLTTTIPHEVAHLHILWTSRTKRRRPRPHGPEWQAVMRDCFALEPQRCHDYQTTPARVVPRNFLYRCSCRTHRLTSIMHNRIRRAGGAACRRCKAALVFQCQEL